MPPSIENDTTAALDVEITHSDVTGVTAPKNSTLVLREVKACPECSQRFTADAMFCPFDGTLLAMVPWDPSGDALLGKTIDGRYLVLGVLGEGGMGKVYEVKHVSLNRCFALKALRRDLANDEQLSERFIQEARATAAIRHPNIVSITDFGALPDGRPYFVMELLTGQTLGQLIKTGGPVPAGRAVRIVRQVAGALGAAHAAGIVHRDLKPENVFLVKGAAGAQGDSEVRIVDFGAAKILGASRLTKAGIVFGTPHYMSPEQASGEAIDHRADVYALGVIMYEMFTGRVPFEADTYMGVLTQHMFVQPLPPSQVCPAARELGALERVTLKALEKKPEERYASMEDLAKDIDRVARVSSDGRVSIVDGVVDPGERQPRSSGRARMADELEPPTLEEMRAAVESLAAPPRATPWLPWLIGSAGIGVAAAAILLLFNHTRNDASAQPAPAIAASPATSIGPAIPPPPSAMSAAPRKLTLSSTPSAAQVFQDGTLVGTTPLELALEASAAPVKYTLKAAGYLDQDVVLDPSTNTDTKVDLHRAPAAAPPRPSRPTVPTGGGDMDDPFLKRKR